jgi:hypothetical protein
MKNWWKLYAGWFSCVLCLGVLGYVYYKKNGIADADPDAE